MFLKRDAMVMNAQGGLRSLRDSTGGVTLGDIGSTCTGTISTTQHDGYGNIRRSPASLLGRFLPLRLTPSSG
jgi:hypothetical protein